MSVIGVFWTIAVMITMLAWKIASDNGGRMIVGRVRFTLRALLLFMLMFSVMLAWKTNQVRTRAEAIRKLTCIGGRIEWTLRYVNPITRNPLGIGQISQGSMWFGEFYRVDYVELTSQEVNDIFISDTIVVLQDATRLVLDGTKITDASLKNLSTADGLIYLDLSNTSVTNEGIAHLSGLQNLKGLVVKSTALTDEGLAHIAKMRSLELLVLDQTQVSGSGFRHLDQLPVLRLLSLQGTSVDDIGLLELRHLQHLEIVKATKSAVTEEGAEELCRILPGCRVIPGSRGIRN